MSRLTYHQVQTLLRPIKPERVMQANGQSHVPAYDVAAHLNRIFGFTNWDTDILSKELLFETSAGDSRPKWTVGYSASVRVTIKDTDGVELAHWENAAAGEAINQPSRADAHHLALTTAVSTAMKRCVAFGLGDQFGLSLYNKGSVSALVGITLDMPAEVGTEATDVEAAAPVPMSLGNDERQVQLPDGAVETPPSAPLTALQRQIKEHPRYKVMDLSARGEFLSDHAGFQVTSLRALNDDDCEAILAALNRKGEA